MGKGKNNTTEVEEPPSLNFFLPYHSFLHFAPAIENYTFIAQAFYVLWVLHIFILFLVKVWHKDLTYFSVEVSVLV